MPQQPAWDLLVDRDDHVVTRLVDAPAPAHGDGEALLRVDRVGLSANNVTYAVLGEQLRYWDFFPAEAGWGRVPLWGFADVVASAVDGLEVGARVYGYLPTSSHLLVRPQRVTARGFRDASPHRAGLPGAYQSYDLTGEAASADEDLAALYRPLFMLAFVLDDFLADLSGVEAVVLSSASSKTASATAFLLAARDDGPQVVGLTSAGNRAFTQGLGCYDRVLAYDEVGDLGLVGTAFADVAGSAAVRAAVRRRLGDRLVHDAAVGFTHHDQGRDEAAPGPAPTVFFAPDRMALRSKQWGREVFAACVADAWERFAAAASSWVDVEVATGPQGLQTTWERMLAGGSPRVGHVVDLGSSPPSTPRPQGP